MADGSNLSITQKFMGMDTDSILERVEENWYIAGRNFYLYAGADGYAGAVRKLGGTREIPWDAPAGENTGLGCYWDQRGNTLIVFVHNSLGQHSILWMHTDEANARTITSEAFNFTLGNTITGVALINGELLAFTDGADYIKCINLPRADNTDKKAIVRLYLPHADRIVQNREYNVQVVTNGSPGGSTATWDETDSAAIRDFTPMIRNFADQFATYGFLTSAFTVKPMANYVELAAMNAGDYSIFVTVTDTINSAIQPVVTCIAEFQNRYNDPFTSEQVRLGTPVPIAPPTAILGDDPSRRTSLIRSKQLQFTYGYRMRDKQRTKTGPISDIGLPIVSVCQNAAVDYNCVDIDFSTDKWLSEPAMRGEIEFVDIYMREGNIGSFSLVKSLEKHEWIYTRTWRFFNDEYYTGADKAFVLAGNTDMPPQAKALTLIADATDNQRIVVGGCKEGDPTPSVEAVTNVRLDGNVTITRGDVEVYARVLINGVFDSSPGQYYNTNQPIVVYDNGVGPVYGGMGAGITALIEFFTSNPELWNQKIPLGGFVGYMAGTDLVGISTQTNFPATVGNGSVAATLWQPSDPNDIAAGRNVYDGTRQGFSLNPVNDTHRQAIRDMIVDSRIYSELRIGGLERGKTYVLRMASNLCDRTVGSIYNIDAPDRGYQRTSAFTVQVGSVSGDPNIKIGRTECTITVPLTGPAVIDIGNIVIMDTTNPNLVTGSFVIGGYCFDNLGVDYSVNADVRLLGIPAERQMIRVLNHTPSGYGQFPKAGVSFWALAPFLWPALAATVVYDAFLLAMFGGVAGSDDTHTFTDHNGFWFFFNENSIGDNPQAAWLSITGDPFNPSGTIPVLSASSTGYIVANDFTGALASKWEGGLTGALTGPITGNLFNGPGWQSYIQANKYSGTNMRTHIRTRIADASGVPIQGVRALLENGRYKDSDGLGNIDLVVFGDVEANLNNRVRDNLLLFFPGPCDVTFQAGAIVSIQITTFQSGGQWADSPDIYHYYVSDRIATLSGGGDRAFGRGGVYLIGCYLKRWNGDRTPVQPLGKKRIPLLTEDLNRYDPLEYPTSPTYSAGVGRIDWELIGDVPIPWIGRWEALQFCITDDTTRFWMLQWLASGVTYSSIWDSSISEPTNVGFTNGGATEIYIELTDSTTRYNDLHTGSLVNQTVPNTGYAWSAGDMLRILTDSNGVPRNGIVMEVEITGQRGKWITIAATSAIPQLFGGEVIEIFRPRKPVDSDIATYYDMPNGLVLIDDPYGATPAWSATSGTFLWGDTWILPTQVPILPDVNQPWRAVNVNRESKWQSDFFASQNYGKGKPWFSNPDAATEDRPGLMRHSDAFKPGTNINGLNMFGGLSLRIVENWLGRIMVMIRLQDVIFVVCENGCFSIYVGVQQLQTTPDSQTEVTGGILGNVRPFAHTHGTKHPLSVVHGPTTVMFFDWKNGAYVQYDGNALGDRATQERMHAWFTTKSMDLPDNANVCGGWDMAYGQFICSFPTVFHENYDENGEPAPTKVPAESVTYHDKANKFTAMWDYQPNCWGTTRQALWSFKDGRLLLHNAPGAVGNRIDGVDLELSVTPAFIGSETTVKQPLALWLGRGPGWEVTKVTVSDEGQVSIIPEEDFVTPRGGVSKAQFYRDQNTPTSALTIPQLSNGDQLIGTAFAVELRFVGPGKCRLLNATMFYIDMTPTN